VKEQDLPMAVATGVLDVMMTAPGYLSSSVPAAGIVGDYPLYRSYQTAEKAFYEVNKIISPVYKEKLKIMPIAEVFLAPFYLWTKKPVKTMEDIKGLKIRAHGGLVPFIISNLGGSPTTTATTDVYMALERGLIDGAIRNLAAYNSFKEYEFAKYGLNINITWAAAHVFISTKTWNKLPKDLQLILWDTGRQATIYNAKFWEKVNNKFKSQFGDQKVVFSEVLETAKDPMMEAIKNGANQGAQKLSSQYAESIIKAFKKSAE
jgi:TRAP-type C4-dicarboxylate transport system substrate-binding protein